MIQKIGINFSRIERLKRLARGEEIPKYLYHLTNEKSAQKIIESGIIKTSKDGCYSNNANCLQGVFSFDILNLLKWGHSADWNGDLALSLIKQASKGNDKLILFKIPTVSLDKNKLQVRSQNHLFNKNKPLDATMNPQHRVIGDNAAEFAEFYDKNNAVEYIYLDNIPVTSTNIIGEASAKKVREQLPQKPSTRDWVSFAFKNLFKTEKSNDKKLVDQMFST